jgi:hypothetical protein
VCGKKGLREVGDDGKIHLILGGMKDNLGMWDFHGKGLRNG